MNFTLRLQAPAYGGLTFLELLLGAAAGAKSGGAVFAFATSSGASLLLEDPVFTSFLARASFDLIVGVDAVTLPTTLHFLGEAAKTQKNLTARAFLHERRGALFHPKLCWFRGDDTCRVLVGSANLTRGGLLNNWEALGDVTLEDADLRAFLDSWNSWLRHESGQLLPVDDPGAISRARLNESDERRHEEDQVEQADFDLDGVPADAPVLLAEIPRGGDRWNQANIDLATFREFFQVQPGEYHRIMLFPVDAGGVVGGLESRQGVSVRSHNFRVELGQAAGIPYPDDGRPIGLFLRIGTRRFRYRLLLPGHLDYTRVTAILDAKWSGPGRQLRRVRLSLEQIRELVPELIL